MSLPQWLNPPGFLGTVTERISTSTFIAGEPIGVESILFSSAGQGYSSGMTIVVPYQHTYGSNESIIPTINEATGAIKSVTIADKGNGYLYPTTVTIVKPADVTTPGTANPSATTLTLTTSSLKIYTGMIVTGNGIDTSTVVRSYVGNIVTLSTATVSAIAGDDITFSDQGYGAAGSVTLITPKVTYSVISGALPGGLKLTSPGGLNSSSAGLISGTPFSVGQKITSQFVVRAKNSNGITDRTFIIDTQGATDPVWLTPEGYLSVGLGGQQYVVNKEYVDYQFSAIYDVLPAGQKLRYYIGDNEGELPPGLTLTEDGRLSGYVIDTLGIDALASPIGGYDAERYDSYPYDHAIQYGGSVVVQRPKFLAKIYQFYITVTDSIASSRRLFQIKIEDPSSFKADINVALFDNVVNPETFKNPKIVVLFDKVVNPETFNDETSVTLLFNVLNPLTFNDDNNATLPFITILSIDPNPKKKIIHSSHTTKLQIHSFSFQVLWWSQYYQLSMCVMWCSPYYMCEQSNTMLSINLLTFVMLRDARPGDTEPVIVILHECHVLQQSAIEALLNRTFGCTAMCMLIHFRPGTNYAALTLHPFFSAFLRMSLKFMVPDVDRN